MKLHPVLIKKLQLPLFIMKTDLRSKLNLLNTLISFKSNFNFRGQQYFHTHIFAMFIAKFSGLITILAIPTIRNVLMYTKMSGEPLTAYRRYLATVFHMYVWYKSDFKPGSE